MFSFHSVSVFMFTVYCLMDPCGLISNKDDDDDEYAPSYQYIQKTRVYLKI